LINIELNQDERVQLAKAKWESARENPHLSRSEIQVYENKYRHELVLSHIFGRFVDVKNKIDIERKMSTMSKFMIYSIKYWIYSF
jgi:hypothetical protein